MFTPVLPWLDPVEQKEVVAALIRWNLLKFSDGREFVLKSGKRADIYVNLRDARSTPEAMEVISELYTNPLRRLRLDQFFEVPDSVSCFAPLIARKLKCGYITVREQAKASRVVKGIMIGHAPRGARVPGIDDVITDGASKIVPYRECIKAGFNVPGLVVLVDRQEGWQKTFADEKINMPVWAGMTIHDVRRFLISDFRVMERCDPEVEEKNPIIVGLDGTTWEEILPVIDELRPTGCILKVNDLLLAKDADWLLPNLLVYARRIMADCKGLDVATTLKNYAKVLLRTPPWALTVHASGGEDMMRTVVQAFKDTPTKILAVTVLTSFDEKTCQEIYTRIPFEQVCVLARIAHRAGVHGFVCSPEEALELRTRYPGKEIVTPGVRSPGVASGVQKRVNTPKEAIEWGATKIVMTSQVLTAANPVLEVRRVLTEELGITV